MTSGDILFERRGAAGLVTLNRPQALNAVSLVMVRAPCRSRQPLVGFHGGIVPDATLSWMAMISGCTASYDSIENGPEPPG